MKEKLKENVRHFGGRRRGQPREAPLPRLPLGQHRKRLMFIQLQSRSPDAAAVVAANVKGWWFRDWNVEEKTERSEPKCRGIALVAVRDRCSLSTLRKSQHVVNVPRLFLSVRLSFAPTTNVNAPYSYHILVLETLTPFCRLMNTAVTNGRRFGHPRCTPPQLLPASKRPMQFLLALHPVCTSKGSERSRFRIQYELAQNCANR